MTADRESADREPARKRLQTSGKKVSPETFDEMRDDPAAWATNARHLMDAAKMLAEAERRPNVAALLDAVSCTSTGSAAARVFVGPRLLLAGLATENLLKALVVGRDASGAEPGKLGKVIDGHSIVKLAEPAGVTFTEDETVFLRHMSEVVVWAGRYQIGRRAESTPRVSAMSSDAFDAAARIFDTLMRVYSDRHGALPPVATSDGAE